MRKLDLYLIIGVIFSLVPIYSKIGWVYLCAIYPDLTLAETGELYNSQILFNIFSGRFNDSIFIIVCGLISCGFLYLSYLNSVKIDGITKKIKTGLLYTSAIFTFWEIFGLM